MPTAVFTKTSARASVVAALCLLAGACEAGSGAPSSTPSQHQARPTPAASTAASPAASSTVDACLTGTSNTCAARSNPPSATPSQRRVPRTPLPSPAIDACLVGSWNELHYESFIDLTAFGGGAAIVSGAGRILTFEASGFETVDYGSGHTYHGVGEDGTVAFTISGRLVFRVATAKGMLSFTTVKNEVMIVWRADGRVVATGPMSSTPGPVSYTCAGDRMTQSVPPTYRAAYKRVRADG